uniref:Mitochondrial carrier protein n=1 Tax=Panagrolaimus sp. ES5 TaxID=591445 RepID=A0AC34FAJ0_9BILA
MSLKTTTTSLSSTTNLKGPPVPIETHLAVAAPGNHNEVKIGTPKYMLLSGFAGGIVAGGSHFLVTPIDVIHVRIQSHSPRFSKFFAAFRTTFAEEGVRGLARGWAPNLIGYSAQGFAKFGLYETLKKEYSAAVGVEFAAKHKTAIYLLAGASAETVGTLLLAPFESVKIRVQTCADIPPQFRRALPYIWKAEGVNGLFKGLAPLLLRQIPYTASKFVCFEWSREIIYQKILKVDPVTLNSSEKMAVTITAGIIAGMLF